MSETIRPSETSATNETLTAHRNLNLTLRGLSKVTKILHYLIQGVF